MRSRPELRLDHAIRQGRAANNFDLLRLGGALLVLFAHSFALTGSSEPIPARLHEDWGEVGVIVFFSISGFLIARSWAYDPKPFSFAVKRALRLMPALLVSLLLTALVLGPLVTTLPLKTYLEDPERRRTCSATRPSRPTTRWRASSRRRTTRWRSTARCGRCRWS